MYFLLTYNTIAHLIDYDVTQLLYALRNNALYCGELGPNLRYLQGMPVLNKMFVIKVNGHSSFQIPP